MEAPPTEAPPPASETPGPDLNNLPVGRGWFVALGVLMIVLGMVSIIESWLMTLASVLFFGALILIIGVAQIIHGFASRRWSGFFLHLVLGLLYAIAGGIILFEPMRGAIGLTLLLAIYFVVDGVFRIILAFSARGGASRGWIVLSGLISLLLGILIWSQWPASGLWVIGLFVGIQLLLAGWSMVMLSPALAKAAGE